uniref:PB1 domain-containing protein n=1 Tax=Ananas comosus var. bracteatus TaxID=296719 RepID=A0A6V7P3Y4_ANACO|nr:unnamed protein product [Ananas comosus var. bracteatus]
MVSGLPSSDDGPPLQQQQQQRSCTAKFLCSFGGSVLPRPLDGRLRYVGGETRIVAVPRDVCFADLLLRLRDVFDGVDAIKYQQPDEDLDALVSVVNDDDVQNMMEEYDKLVAAGESFTRLRIFLFSHHHLLLLQQNDGFDPAAAAAASIAAHFDAPRTIARPRGGTSTRSTASPTPRRAPRDPARRPTSPPTNSTAAAALISSACAI